ncbi:MAG: DUF4760 domain-containing protein [Candidatus Acidiferrales bacterium]
MSNVTPQHADFLLRLYEMRREPRLRQARAWFMDNFNVTTMAELMAVCPPGTDNNAMMRQVLSFWDMCANFVNRGLIDEEFFWETSGEQFIVFERFKPVLGEIRAMFKNPQFLAHLEEHCRRMEAWREQRAPGSVAALRDFMKQQAAARSGATATAAATGVAATAKAAS